MLLVALFGMPYAEARATDAPLADAGVLDLSEWRFSEDGPAELRGEWEFFADELGVRTSASGDLRSVPESWKRSPGSLAATGFGTYRLRIELGQVPPTLALRLSSVSTAYELRIDGRNLGGIGAVGTSKESSKPASREKVFYLNPTQDSIELELRVSNFHFRTGGLRQAPELGLIEQAGPTRDLRLARALFFFGCFLMLAFYHLLIFSLRRDLKGALYFGLLCLMSSGHLLVVDNDIYQFLLPGIGWETGLRFEYAFFILIGTFFWLYLNTQFPEEFPISATKLVAIGGSILTVSLFLTSTTFSSTITLRIAQLLLLLTLPYVIGRIGLAAIDRRRGATLFLLGAAIFISAGILDSLSSVAPDLLNRAPGLTPIGFLIFVLCQVAIMAGSVARTFGSVEHLSKRLLSLDRLKDEFLANTSHELRTPLNGIIGVADSLRHGGKGDLPGAVRGQLGMIVDSGQRLSRLVDDILDFSRINNSDLKLEPTLCSVHASVEVVTTLLKPLAQKKGIHLHNRVDPDFPCVHADEARLHQILHNLIGNAIKFTAHGGVTVSAEAKNTTATIRVIDSGIGIPENEMAQVFEPFEQGSGGTARVHSGSGLGLAIARQLAELHGGTIRCRSTPGEGSTFYFDLPLSEESLEPGTTTKSDIDLLPAPLPARSSDDSSGELPLGELEPRDPQTVPGTVLIVDDDAVNRTVLVNYLHTENYRVLVAGDSGEALQLMSKRPDLVVLDVMMPRISGFELCKRLRKRYPANELPILFLTAKARSSDVVTGLTIGANDYLTKPINREELLARIATHLEVKRLTDERMSLEQAVFKDPLTGLANRRRFDQAVSEGLGSDDQALSLLYIDLDDFKEINDAYGHEVGDEVLRTTADRLRESVRTHDLVARLGGDEFAIALAAGPEVALATAHRLTAKLREPVHCMGYKVAVGASIGLACRSDQRETVSELLRAADEDMYRKKRSRTPQIVPATVE